MAASQVPIPFLSKALIGLLHASTLFAFYDAYFWAGLVEIVILDRLLIGA